MQTFNELKKNLKKEKSGFKAQKILLIGEFATQLLSIAIKGFGIKEKLDLQIVETDYDQIDGLLIDKSTALWTNKFDCVLIFPSYYKLRKEFYKLGDDDRRTFADNTLQYWKYIIETINEQTKTPVLFANYPNINDGVFGNFFTKVDSSFNFQLLLFNTSLMQLSSKLKFLYINNIQSLQSNNNVSLTENKYYVNGDNIYGLEFLPILAKNTVQMILPFTGIFKKCIILDLDNTTWGGIIGDDGIDNIEIGELGIGKAFTELQTWVKELNKRGTIIAVCSKNDEKIAKEPFEKHSDMVLKLDDISVFVANWGNKADNIRFIQSVLNIGFDSMVFLDDNPFERNLVRTQIPEITVPEIPEDPSDYLSYLVSLNLFETISYTQEDNLRGKLYKEESYRKIQEINYSNIDDYLVSLEMTALTSCITKQNISRCAQLTQRSNQFNLRTKRYTEETIANIIENDQWVSIAINLTDKFGDYGLISLILAQKNDNNALFIDSWIMSCRVLKRTVEEFVMQELVSYCNLNGIGIIIGEYLPTNKNELVKDHYKNLGFAKRENNLWEYSVNSNNQFKTFIKSNNDKGKSIRERRGNF